MTPMICTVCGHRTEMNESNWHREVSACANCKATPRFCGVASAVLECITGETTGNLLEMTPRKHLRAIGISDATFYAKILCKKLSYDNTYYHTSPFLNICDPLSCSNYQNVDLIICSDVIEHTFDPPAAVLSNIRSMLRIGGTLILSAPTHQMAHTIEWYGGAKSVEVQNRDGEYVVAWKNIRGTQYVDDHPSFHGGPGDTLEMRLISHEDLLRAGALAGLRTQTLQFRKDRGYYWPLLQMNHLLPGRSDSRIITMTRI